MNIVTLDSARIIARLNSPVFYHGGPRGLKKILPSGTTGTRSYAADLSDVCRRDRVYVTADFGAAVLYAACHERGVVYEVNPVGEMTEDRDCTSAGLSWECEAADIVRVHKPKGKMLRTARKAILR